MSRVETAAAIDRLPWLPDEPAAKRPRRNGRLKIGSAFVVTLLVGASAFWLGTRTVDEQAPPAAKKEATVRLPDARPSVPAQPQVKLAPVPEVEPIVAPPMPVIEPTPPVRRPIEKPLPAPRQAAEAAPVVKEPPKPAPDALPRPWPVRVIDGAAGRLVRIGAFSSVHQAKRGWWAIVKVNPALKRLPALVVPVRSLRNGRVYYRLQMGTTSQAHSAVLCQRMRMIAQPCVVIGTPGGQ
jgi:hypothetical protein